MYAIAKHEEGITLNDYIYAIDKDGEVITFDTREEAKNYLTKNSDVDQTLEEWEEEGIYVVQFD